MGWMMSEFELIAATDPPKISVTPDKTLCGEELVALYPEMETDDASAITITDPSHDHTHGDDTGNIDLDTDDGTDPTHECQSCGTGQRIDTPYSSLDAWCESCDAVRNHKRVTVEEPSD
jgi:hypothetical protein